MLKMVKIIKNVENKVWRIGEKYTKNLLKKLLPYMLSKKLTK